MQFPSYTQSHCYAPASPGLHVNEICPLSRTKHLSGRGPWIWANIIFTSEGARGISWDSPGWARLSAGISVLSAAECAPESTACWSKFLPRTGEVPSLFISPEEQQVIKSPSEKREREISGFHIKKSKKISQNYLGFKQGLGRQLREGILNPCVMWCGMIWSVCVLGYASWANETCHTCALLWKGTFKIILRKRSNFLNDVYPYSQESKSTEKQKLELTYS